MKSRIVFGLAGALLAGGGLWLALRPPEAPARGPGGAVAAVAILPTAKPQASAGGLVLDGDPVQNFQRAFWRRPTADDHIDHAVRREWMDPAQGVQKWQWFMDVRPSPAFREWLLKDNPFDLAAVPAGAPMPDLGAPPAWLPPADELATFTRYRNREGRFHVFLDETHNRLYATDQGGGFAVARK